MKSNDNIPEDEFLLARMIAEAKGRGYARTQHERFRYNDQMEVVSCCALGILECLGIIPPSPAEGCFGNIWVGNDQAEFDNTWGLYEHDGEDLGYAWYQAMGDDE